LAIRAYPLNPWFQLRRLGSAASRRASRLPEPNKQRLGPFGLVSESVCRATVVGRRDLQIPDDGQKRLGEQAAVLQRLVFADGSEAETVLAVGAVGGALSKNEELQSAT
jgi:hypothetical protein